MLSYWALHHRANSEYIQKESWEFEIAFHNELSIIEPIHRVYSEGILRVWDCLPKSSYQLDTMLIFSPVKVFEIITRNVLLLKENLRIFQCWWSQLMYSFHTACVLSLHTQVPMPSTVLKADAGNEIGNEFRTLT